MEVNSKGIRWIRYDERTRTLDVAYTEQLLGDSLQSAKSKED